MNSRHQLQIDRIGRIIIPVIAGVGHALMAVPLVRQLKCGFPRAQLTVVVRTRTIAEIFAPLEEVDAVRIMGPGLPGMWRSMAVPPRADVCIVPFPSNRWQYAAMALASGARQRIIHGYPVGRLRALNCVPAMRLPAVRGLHDVVQNLYLLRMLGLEPDITEAPQFPISPHDRSQARSRLESLGIAAGQRPIIIHPGASPVSPAAAGRWPAEAWGLLIAELSRRYQNPIVIIEGPQEIGADAVLRHCDTDKPGVLPLGGTLAEAAGILGESRVYIGAACGLAHLAAAVGTPPVTLFAPTDPERVSPFGYRHLAVQPRGRSCSPCMLYPFLSTQPKPFCREPFCVNDIHVADVLAAVELAMIAP